MRYQAVIFDLDGTILDCENLWERSSIETIKSKNRHCYTALINEVIAKIRGVSSKKACDIIKNTFQLQDNLESLMNEQRNIYSRYFFQEAKFIDGFLDFHNTIIEKEFKTGIATNASNNIIALAKNKFDLERLFGTHIYGVEDVNYEGKPNPAVYLLAAKKLNVEPQYCIAIEDSRCGIQAAKAAGIFCIGINSGKNRELISNADLIVDDYKEINLNTIIK